MSAPSPSATVMLLRDCDKHGIEALLVQRNSTLRTGGGAWVFPGGRVDDQDYLDDDPYRAALNAAVRETFEETGIRLQAEQLTAFAHWTTPPETQRRFATWFFCAHLEQACEVQVDGSEIVAHRWFAPQAAFKAQRQGEITLMPPTFVSLSLLGGYSSCAAALSDFAARETQHFHPRICQSEGGRIILYDDDAGYRSGDPATAGRRHRIVMCGNDWRYENSQ